MYRYGLHSVRHVVSSSGEFHRLLRAPATKCPRDETEGNEVSPRRNDRRRSVPATKWLATKCTSPTMPDALTKALEDVVPINTKRSTVAIICSKSMHTHHMTLKVFYINWSCDTPKCAILVM